MITSLDSSPRFSSHLQLVNPVKRAVKSAQDYLLSIQHPDGHWCAELESHTILESEYILIMHYLGRSHEKKVHKAAEYLRQVQLADGGWGLYPGGPPNVTPSVKAYFVLKLLGDDASAPHMRKARQTILQLGGIEACNSYTKIYLAIFGQYDWNKCPAVIPEVILFPNWFYFNLYELSSWTRAIVVPLSVLWASKPHCPVAASANISELFVDGEGAPEVAGPVNAPTTAKGYFWFYFFKQADRVLKIAERQRALWVLPFNPLRKRALEDAEAWMLQRLRKSDGIAAIFPPIINTIIALHCLGYSLDDPIIKGQIQELEKLEIEEEEVMRIQPCLSPVWDTGLTMGALLASGMSSEHPQLLKAGSWLLDKEVREAGDMQIKYPQTPIGGWYFEYENEFYPDTDDTGEILTILSKLRYSNAEEEQRRHAAIQRGLDWLLFMQNRDGGWGAFDKECNKEIFNYIPFADHNAMLDPSHEDITGRNLETLMALNVGQDHRTVRQAIAFLRKNQLPDGTWYGRWGANYIYGTWLAIRGLHLAGEDMRAPRYQKTKQWFYAHQNQDGGWGESLASYDIPALKGDGESTAAQTAWSLMALFAFGDYDSQAIQQGLGYLLRNQLEDGSWYDEKWTATGFPRVLYLHYHLYASYFSLLALGIYAQGVRSRE
jgi:squalene-hopene/tetraprenyl-beta-curcumene cyclase